MTYKLPLAHFVKADEFTSLLASIHALCPLCCNTARPILYISSAVLAVGILLIVYSVRMYLAIKHVMADILA